MCPKLTLLQIILIANLEGRRDSSSFWKIQFTIICWNSSIRL